MKDFILPYIHPDSNPLTFDNNMNNDKNGDKIFESIDKPIKKIFKYDSSKISDEQITDLLDQLPFEYIEDYDKWSIIANVLKGLDKRIYGINGHINQIDTTKLKMLLYGEILKKIKFDINYIVNVINQTKNKN